MANGDRMMIDVAVLVSSRSISAGAAGRGGRVGLVSAAAVIPGGYSD